MGNATPLRRVIAWFPRISAGARPQGVRIRSQVGTRPPGAVASYTDIGNPCPATRAADPPPARSDRVLPFPLPLDSGPPREKKRPARAGFMPVRHGAETLRDVGSATPAGTWKPCASDHSSPSIRRRGSDSIAALPPLRHLRLHSGHAPTGARPMPAGRHALDFVTGRQTNRYWQAFPPPPTCRDTTLRSATGNGKRQMFDRRDELIKFLAVAEAGGVTAAADLLGITQPALSRIIAKLERRFRGRLFERLPTGVRLTRLGGAAFDLARHLRDETEAAEAKFEAFTTGRSGSFRVTAEPTWMQAVMPAAVARFHADCPGVELKLRTAGFRRGVRLLTDGRERPSLRRHRRGRTAAPAPQTERFLDTTVGIVAHAGHPLHAQAPAPADLAGYPWIDFDAPPRLDIRRPRPSLAAVLEDLLGRTNRRVQTIIRAGAAASSCWRLAPTSRGCRSASWSSCPGPRSGRCRWSSGGTAAGPGSCRGARPRTCRRSGCSGRPCGTWRWVGAADAVAPAGATRIRSKSRLGVLHQRSCAVVHSLGAGHPTPCRQVRCFAGRVHAAWSLSIPKFAPARSG